MNIKKTITIELSESDVKTIIAEYLNKEGYNIKSDDISINIEEKWMGYGRDEHKELYLKNITVKCKEK